MPNKFTLSKRADQQLKKIYRDTEKKWGAKQADKYNAELYQAVKLLADNPSLGRSCDEIKTGLHRHEHGRHIIFYRKRKTPIFIVSIPYDRMDVKRQL